MILSSSCPDSFLSLSWMGRLLVHSIHSLPSLPIPPPPILSYFSSITLILVLPDPPKYTTIHPSSYNSENDSYEFPKKKKIKTFGFYWSFFPVRSGGLYTVSNT